MPINANARAYSAIAAIGLFMTGLVLAYLNSTTSAYFWSTVYLIAEIVTVIAMLSKLAAALGIENGVMVFADKVLSIVPFVALYFNGIQALHYTRDGAEGFWAFFAGMALGVVAFSGLTDSVATWAGKKYAEASERVGAAAEALQHGRH